MGQTLSEPVVEKVRVFVKWKCRFFVSKPNFGAPRSGLAGHDCLGYIADEHVHGGGDLYGLITIADLSVSALGYWRYNALCYFSS
jgi:hypothetical protein